MHRFKTFLSDTKASTTYVFAIALFPLVGTLGLGVDYSRALQARAQLQGAVDSTVIMLAKEAPKNDQAKLTGLAKPYFNGVIAHQPDLITSGLAVTKTDKLVGLSATGTVNTTFAGLFGWQKWTIDVAAEAAYGTKKIELALVLDNTGSMASANKIQELKKASHTLLDILAKTSAIPDQVKVSIVPYTTRVNLSKAYKNETWLTNTPTGTFAGGYAVPATRDAWQGCVADRDTGYNTATKPAGVLEQSRYPMVNCADGLVELMPLTSNWSALHKRIDAMNASGMTNITLGAQWGYETLSGEKPFSEHDSAPNVERFMILLTDGNNTQDRWGAWNEPRMNKDTQAMCDAIVERGTAESAKKLKIKLYTVLVIAGNEPLLKSCASSPSMFKKVNKASELEAVFRKIAEDIGQIHLTM